MKNNKTNLVVDKNLFREFWLECNSYRITPTSFLEYFMKQFIENSEISEEFVKIYINSLQNRKYTEKMQMRFNQIRETKTILNNDIIENSADLSDESIKENSNN